MSGSLLYHMAMVSKMEAETRVLIDALDVEAPNVNANLWRFYSDFAQDAAQLTTQVNLNIDPRKIASDLNLISEEKIRLFNSLKKKTNDALGLLNEKNPDTAAAVEVLFQEWSEQVAEMRFRQEYQTIRGLLILSELSQKL